MSGYRISEVAERTGFSPPTLRYYEEIGLVRPPERTDSGYRRYDDHAVDLFRFIARSKRLGLTLEEISGLIELWEAEECAPVQERLRDLLIAKQRAAAEQIADLESFNRELARVADRLGLPASPGACNDACACLTEDQTTATPVACTLDVAEMPGRLAQWRHLGEHVVARTDTDDGMFVRFDTSVSAADVADLAAKEQGCCSFLTFTIHIAGEGTTLDIGAPAEARELVSMFFDQDR
jgi:DNA-binding transcriptional MerR regulator